MTLERKIFYQVIGLIALLIAAICVASSFFVISEHRSDMKSFFQTQALVLAKQAERLILWNDTLALHRQLQEVVRGDPVLEYAFVEQKGRPKAHTFVKGVPRTLLGRQIVSGTGTVWEFRDLEGAILFDVAAGMAKIDAVLHLGLRRDVIDQQTHPHLARISILGGTTVLISGLLALLLARVTTRDVNRLTQALQQSEERYRVLFDQAADPMVVCDGESGAILDFNESAYKNLGYTREEFQKLKIADLDINESADEVAKHAQKVLEEGADTFETKMRTKDGEIRHILVNAKTMSFSKRVLVSSIWRDITELRLAERVLSYQANLLQNVSDAIIAVDMDLCISSWNKAAEKAYGWRECEVATRRVFDVLETEFIDETREEARERLNKTGRWDGEVRQKTRTGETIDIFASVSWIRDSKGKRVGIITVGHDITGRKRAEEQIRRNSEQLEQMVRERTTRIRELERRRSEVEKLAATGRMAARIAHEINNPLGGIKNSFLLIKDAVPEDHPYFEYVERIKKEIDRVTDIVRQMYGLYKPPAESVQEFSVEGVIRDIIVLLESSTRASQVRLEFDSMQVSGRVALPECLFRQVCYNIFQNAIEASPSGEVVRIAAAVDEDGLTLTVADRGSGIAEEVRSRIFESFFTTKDGSMTGGLGLGLSVCRNIVDSLNGCIEIRDETGWRTVFHIALPHGKARKMLDNR